MTSTDTIDITPLTQTGMELQQAIFDAVKDTQGAIMTPLPNVLVMSAEQFQDQDPLGGMIMAYKSKDRVYITPYNAMDIVVKDPQNLPLEETRD
jgi:hypothetical protein